MTEPSETFLCPITHEIMTDPVIDPDGNSYERSAIENWLQQNGTSPITRQPLNLIDLRPNRALKAAIDEYRASKEIAGKVSEENQVKDLPHVDITPKASYCDGFLKITLQPPQIENRSPCDICCVVDTSGSMAINADIVGQKESSGLTRLDLVKHSIKTIVQSLQADDRLSVVSFSNSANILFGLTKMDQDGKSSALAALERLEDNGQTNLWDGLRQGVEVLLHGQRAVNSNAAVFLLTDGCPNVEPPRGHLPTLEKLKKNSNFTCSINTFGFGYDLDSKLLEDLAIVGNYGSYAFIPDGSFVGTIFVNAITTLLCTIATNVKVVVRGEKIPSSFYTRQQLTTEENESTIFDLGSICYGQNRELIFPMPVETLGNIQIEVLYDTTYQKKRSQPISIETDAAIIDKNSFARENLRLRFIDCVRNIFEVKRPIKTNGTVDSQKLAEGLEKIKELENDLKAFDNGNNPYIQDLLKDLTGQVDEAIRDDDSFKRWGIHYLSSLSRAHLLQICNNFKDPGVQHYGSGRLFADIRDQMDTIFCSLPAPKPPNPTTPPVSMASYYDASGGCFYGRCLIQLADGTTKLVQDVQPGDRLAPFGATVKFVVKNQCVNNTAKMVVLDEGLIISSWHPVRINHQWIMPCNLVSGPTEIFTNEIYNFVLDQDHIVIINGIECVTLGHGFRDDIVRHHYYGTERVINDLRFLDSQQNNNGIIVYSRDSLVRDSQNGRVISLLASTHPTVQMVFAQ